MPTTSTAHRSATIRCPFCSTLNRVDLTRLGQGPKCSECGKPLRLDRPVKATDADFQQTIANTSVPVVVDFYADWCGPCKMMAPVLDDFAHQHAGQVLVLKLDTDANPATAQRFGIRGIPTLIAFRQGQEAARRVGLVQRPELDALVAGT